MYECQVSATRLSRDPVRKTRRQMREQRKAEVSEKFQLTGREVKDRLRISLTTEQRGWP
jgi:hypothetical protein